ncbi:class I adenylate-forming enzyme family protein, partial [Catellatospora methionotrophica]|uniref:class I adenylate-forming enzyme family protein n=1 Tax=Catellatospora methionotrophica TaxID=121620 RepID=UPI0033DB219D
PGRAAYADLLAHPGRAVAQVCDPQDAALDVFSSGTTGQAKCVSFSHGALWRNVRAYADRLALSGRDVLYSPLPLSLAGVLGMVLLPGLLAGASVHLGRLGGAQAAWAGRQLDAAEPTLLYGVPYTFEILARQRAPRRTAALRWAVCSSAPLPAATFDRVHAHLGVPPRSSYCLVEAGTVTVNTSADLDELRHTVGGVLDGVELTLEPAADGAGRIVIGGTSCGSGYRHDGVLRPFPGGAVRTNDLGRLAGGQLVVTGRVDEVIQVAGQSVDLAHLSRVLADCPGLGDHAVVVDQHEQLGTVPVLLVETGSTTASAAELLAFCRARLRAVEVPRQVRFVDTIARTATGKVPLAGAGPQREGAGS